jgi:hypothetical protein
MVLPLLLTLLVSASPTAPGSEVVLVLDNSASMGVGATATTGRRIPANDPERAAVLGALLLEGLTRNSQDGFTVISFGPTPTSAPGVSRTAAELLAMPYIGGTFFKRPLEEARRVLEGSARRRRMLLFFTDGSPSQGDVQSPAEGPALLNMDSHLFETRVVGLYGTAEARQSGEPFLKALARTPEDLLVVEKPREVVGAFTRGFATALGSRPLTGVLRPGEKRALQVDKYVTEVLVALASADRGEPFQAALEGPGGPVPASASGDNRCTFPAQIADAPPELCAAPYRTYQAFRAANDPERASQWTLSLPQAPGAVDFGAILRYDLAAELTAPATARVGEPVTVTARLLFQGKPFDDEGFFARDGFRAELRVGDQVLPLTHAGAGRFEATWTPSSPSEEGRPLHLEARFVNQWMEQRAGAQVTVEGFLDLALRVNPALLDLGRWQGERGNSQRCARLDLSGSLNADRVPVTCTAGAAPGGGFQATCNPVAGSEAQLPNGRRGRPLQYEVCVQAPGCCGVLSPRAAVTLSGQHAHYAAGAVQVPVTAEVAPTGFLRCYAPWLLAAASVLFALWLLLGFTRPHDFTPGFSVTLAGDERGMQRAAPLGVAEQPGGKRGFYRNARMCVDASGDFHRKPARAVLVVEATAGGGARFARAAGLEVRDGRTGKWAPVPEAEFPSGPVPNQLYRVGGLLLKWS